MTKLGHPLELPQEYAADGYQVGGEARGGDFARIELPHPDRGLLPDAKVRIDSNSPNVRPDILSGSRGVEPRQFPPEGLQGAAGVVAGP